MEAISKYNIKSDIRFDISIKWTTWIGHKSTRSDSSILSECNAQDVCIDEFSEERITFLLKQ